MMPETLDSDPEVAGWGAIDVLARRFADVLQYVVVPFFGKEKCDNVYKVISRHKSDSRISHVPGSVRQPQISRNIYFTFRAVNIFTSILIHFLYMLLLFLFSMLPELKHLMRNSF